jgi:hypothetical protein
MPYTPHPKVEAHRARTGHLDNWWFEFEGMVAVVCVDCRDDPQPDPPESCEGVMITRANLHAKLIELSGDNSATEDIWHDYLVVAKLAETLHEPTCPWDQLDGICPKHGAPLKDCPWMHHQMPTYHIEVHEAG